MYRIKKEIKVPRAYLEDCLKIQKALKDGECEASLEDCYELWRKFSEDYYCAGWMEMEGRDIFKALLPYLEKVK
jgi:hypothetical protein